MNRTPLPTRRSTPGIGRAGTRVLPLLAVVALMLGACGVTTGDEVASGGDSTTAPTDGEQTTTTASDGSGDTTETRPEDDGGDDPTDTPQHSDLSGDSTTRCENKRRETTSPC